jgi:hypothetical protein
MMLTTGLSCPVSVARIFGLSFLFGPDVDVLRREVALLDRNWTIRVERQEGIAVQRDQFRALLYVVTKREQCRRRDEPS